MSIIFVVSFTHKQKNDEIYNDFLKISFKYEQKFEKIMLDISINFDSFTMLTNFDIFENKIDHVLSIIMNI